MMEGNRQTSGELLSEIFNEGGIKNNFTFEYSSNNNIFSFVVMSADSVPSSKTNVFQSKLIY
jgi:hypothetical protein